LTSRPDLLPIDLKRQGRAEVHIPLFYPQDEAEVREMFRVMAKKNKVALPEDAVPAVKAERHLSGADIESIVIGARRRALAAGREGRGGGGVPNVHPGGGGAEKGEGGGGRGAGVRRAALPAAGWAGPRRRGRRSPPPAGAPGGGPPDGARVVGQRGSPRRANY